MNHSRLLVSHRTWTAVWYPSPERCSSRMQQLWFVHLMALHFWLVLQCRGLISVASPVKKKQKNNMYLAIAFPPWPAGCCSSGVILLLWSWSLPPECLWTRESRHDSCMKGEIPLHEKPCWDQVLPPSSVYMAGQCCLWRLNLSTLPSLETQLSVFIEALLYYHPQQRRHASAHAQMLKVQATFICHGVGFFCSWFYFTWLPPLLLQHQTANWNKLLPLIKIRFVNIQLPKIYCKGVIVFRHFKTEIWHIIS